ncbi:acyl-CoA thioesterase [Actinotalea sp.]|uniref:acyl-CoA thioesterase n=1 Tax=Actinotalea sp. TaxID=1872145 RepID=UPI0035666B59
MFSPSTTQLRVRPGDLDMYLHVNNGVYLQMMDIARTNLLADLGAFPKLKARGWYPVVAASTMTYRRSLQLWDRFEITTRVVGWDPRVVYLEQVFRRRGEQVARGLVAGRFLGPAGARVAPEDLVDALEPGTRSPELPADVTSWATAVDVAHRSA